MLEDFVKLVSRNSSKNRMYYIQAFDRTNLTKVVGRKYEGVYVFDRGQEGAIYLPNGNVKKGIRHIWGFDYSLFLGKEIEK